MDEKMLSWTKSGRRLWDPPGKKLLCWEQLLETVPGTGTGGQEVKEAR